jgi:AcrR family transcriptional regulator
VAHQPAAANQSSRAHVGLDAQAVVRAALRLIDAEGVQKFTIRRLSAELGVRGPTIYWHIGSKDALFEAVVTEVIGTMSVATPVDAPWDERLRQFLHTACEHLLAHPGVMELIGSVHSSALARWGGEAFDIMIAAGFDGPAAATYARIAMTHATTTARSDAGVLRSSYMEPVPGAPRRFRVKPEVLDDDLGPVGQMTTYDLDEQHEIVTQIFVDGVRVAAERHRAEH